MVPRHEAGQAGALVTGASYRALGVVRSLGRAGIPVHVARSDEHALALASRYAWRRLSWDEGGSDAERRDALLELCRRHRLEGFTLIPTSDADAALIAREHDALARRFRLTTPPWEILRLAHDKRLALGVAREAGLPVPLSLPLDEALAGDLPFPVIVKPASHDPGSRLPPDKAWRADDPAQLRLLADWLGALTDRASLIVQELIPGHVQLSFAALCRDGQTLAGMCARRTRQFPSDFGRASTYVESVLDESVARDAQLLLERMRFSGIVEVEFKRDPRTHENKLLDVNPRVWGWQSLCARAGVDFPLLLFAMANGEDVAPPNVRAGVRWVRMATDVPAALEGLRHGRLAARQYLSSLRGPIEFAVFAADDPLPAVVNAPMLMAIAARRRLRRGEG
jgi:predicted ATP-grasp superfamily ATP-dependent carboligase